MKIQTPTTGDISLYFHLPFCKKKCPYCHFFVIKDDQDKQKLLFQAILNEIDLKKNHLKNKRIISIYFGGGTPYLFQTLFFQKILEKLYSLEVKIDNDIEITLEANPEDITLEKVKILKDFGINRFSVGVQSLDDDLLKMLSRSHDREKILSSLNILNSCSIKNISIDLMYDIPSQTLDSWKKTIDYIPNLPITHISLYNLTIEPNTAFFRQKTKLTKLRPSNEIAKQMLICALELFQKNNFVRYEISAFAKNENFSMHNLGYWQYREFIGYGPSAFSYFNNQRSRNCSNFEKYINLMNNHKSATDFYDNISNIQKLKEALIISLRLISGINLNLFENKWGKIPSDTLFTLKKLIKDKYLNQTNSQLKLTDKGLLFYDTVASEII